MSSAYVCVRFESGNIFCSHRNPYHDIRHGVGMAMGRHCEANKHIAKIHPARIELATFSMLG